MAVAVARKSRECDSFPRGEKCDKPGGTTKPDSRRSISSAKDARRCERTEREERWQSVSIVGALFFFLVHATLLYVVVVIPAHCGAPSSNDRSVPSISACAAVFYYSKKQCRLLLLRIMPLRQPPPKTRTGGNYYGWRFSWRQQYQQCFGCSCG